MASDGIIFRFLARVHPKYQTPLIATAVSGVFAGLYDLCISIIDMHLMLLRFFKIFIDFNKPVMKLKNFYIVLDVCFKYETNCLLFIY